jgi:predicted nuclease with TOPRIM domain
VSYHTIELTTHLKALEQKEANTPKRSRRREIVKFRAEINQFETRKMIQRINETNSCLFEKMDRRVKPLAKLTKRQNETNKIINEKWGITKSNEETQRIIGSYVKSCTPQNWKI